MGRSTAPIQWACDSFSDFFSIKWVVTLLVCCLLLIQRCTYYGPEDLAVCQHDIKYGEKRARIGILFPRIIIRSLFLIFLPAWCHFGASPDSREVWIQAIYVSFQKFYLYQVAYFQICVSKRSQSWLLSPTLAIKCKQPQFQAPFENLHPKSPPHCILTYVMMEFLPWVAYLINRLLKTA